MPVIAERPRLPDDTPKAAEQILRIGEYGSTQWGSFAAGAVIVSIAVVALFYALQKNLVAGLTAGSSSRRTVVRVHQDTSDMHRYAERGRPTG